MKLKFEIHEQVVDASACLDPRRKSPALSVPFLLGDKAAVDEKSTVFSFADLNGN